MPKLKTSKEVLSAFFQSQIPIKIEKAINNTLVITVFSNPDKIEFTKTTSRNLLNGKRKNKNADAITSKANDDLRYSLIFNF